MATNNTLVCPFLTPDPVFAYGVEFGMLYARMRESDKPISDYFTLANEEQIRLLASRLKWQITEIKTLDRCWFWCRMEPIEQQGVPDATSS